MSGREQIPLALKYPRTAAEAYAPILEAYRKGYASFLKILEAVGGFETTTYFPRSSALDNARQNMENLHHVDAKEKERVLELLARVGKPRSSSVMTTFNSRQPDEAIPPLS